MDDEKVVKCFELPCSLKLNKSLCILKYFKEIYYSVFHAPV